VHNYVFYAAHLQPCLFGWACGILASGLSLVDDTRRVEHTIRTKVNEGSRWLGRNSLRRCNSILFLEIGIKSCSCPYV